MSDFSLPAEERWFREIGRYDNIEVESVKGGTIQCLVTDDETVIVADVSEGISNFRDRRKI